nr:hypothetical protein [Bacteroidota bacterium]
MKRFIIIPLLFSFLCSYSQTLQWIGNRYDSQSSSSQEVTFYVETWEPVFGVSVEVGVEIDGNWSTYFMPYKQPAENNDSWETTISLPSGTHQFYFHAWHDGTDLYDNDGGNNYSTVVSGNETLQDGIWNNVETWSFGAVPNISSSEYVDVVIKHNINLDINSAVTSLEVQSDKAFQIDAGNNLTINEALTVASSKNVKAAGTFTLKSDVSGTGSLITNGSVSGSISVERYMTGNWAWHQLSSPVTDQPFIGADNFIEFTFGGGNEGDPNIDIYRWDETETNASRWINIRAEDKTLNEDFGLPETNPYFEEGLGYLVAYDKGATITKTFNGVPNTGDQNITLTYTPAGGAGWNLVGNPFPSAIDWESASITKTDLAQGYYYVYNQTKDGGAGYEYYLDVDHKSDGVNGKIPAMQAFFVEAASVGSLGIGNA